MFVVIQPVRFGMNDDSTQEKNKNPKVLEIRDEIQSYAVTNAHNNLTNGGAFRKYTKQFRCVRLENKKKCSTATNHYPTGEIKV
jgi:hypothetical protein